MTDTGDDRLRSGLDRLASKAPRAFEPPPAMLRRARRRVAATAVGVVVALTAVTVGGVAVTRSLAGRSGPPVPIESRQPTATAAATGVGSPTPTAAAPAPACAFAAVTLPELPAGRDSLNTLTGTSTDDVWIGGGRFNADFGKPEHTRSLLLHWDGRTIRLLPPSEEMGSVASLDAIAPDDVWAATESGPWHWDGTTWSQFGRPVTAGNTLAISASGPDDVWAIGEDLFATAPFAEHFDGAGWTEVETPAALQQPRKGPLFINMDQVAAVAPDDAWAVGGYFFQGQGTERPAAPIVMHWDGQRWSVVDVPSPSDAAYEADAVAAPGPDDVWVATMETWPDAETGPGSLLHWDGSSWSRVPVEEPAGSVVRIRSLDAPGANDVWAAGTAVDSASGEARPVVEHFDGAGWTIVPVGAGVRERATFVAAVRIVGDEPWAVAGAGVSQALDHPPSVWSCRTP